MNTFTVNPGGRVLWCLRRRASDVRCVLFGGGPGADVGAEVHVLQERDLVLRERFPSDADAVAWAGEYRLRLEQQGWHASPEDCSPSSAA